MNIKQVSSDDPEFQKLLLTFAPDYVNRLQSYLDVLLSRIMPNSVDRNKYLTPQNMVFWIRAFTHKTVSREYSYDLSEFNGDIILKAIFPVYLMRLFNDHKPPLDEAQLTNLNNSYMSKRAQSKISTDLKLDSYVQIVGKRIDAKVSGDIFESFFGTLFYISESFERELGYTVCRTMLENIFAGEESHIDPNIADPTTLVTQIFQRFGLPAPETRKTHIGNLWSYSVLLLPPHVEFLRSLGFDFSYQKLLIGKGQDFERKESQREAYQAALEYLATYGVTPEWASALKSKYDFEDQRIVDLRPYYEAKMKLDGFKEISFITSRETNSTGDATVQLVGISSDNREHILGTRGSDNRDTAAKDAKYQLIKDYVRGIK